jgi:DHA2 family multidrug resistance protein-like MFS transporter
VGGAIGIALLGSVGATLAANSWHSFVSAQVPAPAQNAALGLTPLVQGGRAHTISNLPVPHADALASQALLSFQHGVRGAFFVGACLLFAAAVVAFVGLRSVPAPRQAEAPAGAAVEV